MIKRINFIALTALAIAMATTMSCKKVLNKPDDGGNGNTIDTANSTIRDRLYDSMYLYALQTYYWNDQLPTYMVFNPRQYENANDSLGLANEQYAYTRYPKDSSGNLYEQRIKYNQYGEPIPDNSEPKFSYIIYTSDNTNGGSNSYVPSTNFTNGDPMMYTLDGKDNGFGFVVGLMPASQTGGVLTAKNSDSIYMIAQYVIPGSPANLAGLKRGDVIAKMNDQALDFTNNESSAEATFSSDMKGSTLTIDKYDIQTKTTTKLSLTSKVYTFNPILKSEVLNYNGHSIGYLAFLTFTDSATNAAPVLDSAFQSFANKGITDIVIDLRYNGGGYVNTADHLVDLIVPQSADGKVMHRDYYNQTIVNNSKIPILKTILQDYDNPSSGSLYGIDFSPSAQTTNVAKKGSVNNLSKVYFIVSGGTASASELVINSLKPYVTSEVLIGSQFSDNAEKTYGKPVAFFEIRIGKFSMWTPNFETKNANGGGGYYQGFSTDYQVSDNIVYDFGDPKEYALAKAINLISGVTTQPNLSVASSSKSIIKKIRSIGNVNPVSNMIGKPKRVLK